LAGFSKFASVTLVYTLIGFSDSNSIGIKFYYPFDFYNLVLSILVFGGS
jgi:hypothetical protein